MRVAFLVWALVHAAPASAQQAAWQQWQHLPGVVDVGARADGSLVVMAAGHLYQVARSGTAVPFASGSDGFNASADAESYFVVAPALTVDGAGCAWSADDLFILDLNAAPSVDRVDPAGHASHFASLPNVDTLGGIAIDTTGKFGHRLLVTGTHQGHTTVFALDCAGSSTVVTDSAPTVEGGLAVAPPSFGQFSGDLIAPDENSGQVWAIDPAGGATLVIVPNLPVGGDTGVESGGFVPPGFSGGGAAYLADRATANNPFPGTDSLLRLTSAALAPAGVQDGDLLLSTEGNGTTVAIRCAATCTASEVAQGTPGGHIEGKIALVPDQPTAP
ncbi:MAG TPA: hypothetical protein VKV73_02165 [Chloroflexota bacterium]|nr:hypothetical protein [Chloroflexota bacterium]